jgi:retinol-binding protein 3
MIRIRIRTALITIGALLLLHAPQASAQRFVASPGDLPRIDARTQAAVVESAATAVDTLYVLKDAAERISSLWRTRLAEGAYRDLTDPADLAKRLEDDAVSVREDGHFGIRALFPVDPKEAEPAQSPDQSEAYRRAVRARNYGFRKVEIMPGGVGYLALDMFPATSDAAETAIGAMNFLANSSALIIDLRNNPGGDASMIRLLASYLFAEETHLISWYVRDLDETVQSRTQDYVPGRRMPKVPVFVLTSDRTASAAEEFAFDLKTLKRATVVGDTTARAGHTVTTRIFRFDGFRIGMRIPYGRAFDPRTGEGWEGCGVIPDVAVPETQALSVAQAKALEMLLAQETDPAGQALLKWHLAELKSRDHPIALTPAQLEEYVGVYGPRRIFLDGGRLYSRREGRPPFELAPMDRDLFRVGELTDFRLRFERDEGGRIVRVIGVYDTGQEESLSRAR